MNNDPKKIVRQIAHQGRHGDTSLIHMRPDEIHGIGMLAQALGGKLTKNPKTGLPEAWGLPSWVLPVAAIAATALTAGAAAPAAAGALGAAGGTAAAGGAAAGAAGAAGAGAGALGAGAAGAGAGAAGAAGTAGTGLLGASGATQSGLLAAQEAGLGSSSLGWGGATTGMQGGLNAALGSSTGSSVGGLLADSGQYVKPAIQVGKAIQASQPAQPAPITPQITPQAQGQGPQTLTQLVNMNNQEGQQMLSQENIDAQRRRSLLSNIGRGY